MKKFVGIFFILSVMMFSSRVSASSPVGTSKNFGVGLQFGYPGNGLTFNYYFNQKNSLQINPSLWIRDDWQGIGARFDYLYWMPVIANLPFADFVWYVGPGFHFYSVTWKGDRPADHDSYFNLGIELPIGIGLRFSKIPLDLNLELVPLVEVVEDEGVGIDVGVAAALNIRYYF